MLKLTYRPKTTAKMRMLFSLADGGLSLSGSIFERDDPGTKDRYFWSFMNTFSWKLDNGFPPFKYVNKGKDVSFELFFGVPQLVMLTQFNFVPAAADRYQTDNNRNCGNCAYARFAQDDWTEYYERPVSDRTKPPPRSLYSCAISEERIDDLHRCEKTGFDRLNRAKFTLRENTCSAHSRAAYQTEVDADARERYGITTTERWVPAELRRLGAINPDAIRLVRPGLAEVGGVPIAYAAETS